MASIYLAGKIGLSDWRHGLVRNLRDYWEWDEGRPSAEWPVIQRGVLGTFDYAGPYFMSDDHGCGHGANTHGCGDDGSVCSGAMPAPNRAQVRDLCLNAIDRADIFFAWLDGTSAYGTLVEIGYARGHGKQIIIAAPELPNTFEDSASHGCNFLSHAALNDLWFAFSCATPLIAKTPRAALEKITEAMPRLESPIEEAFWNAYLRAQPAELLGLKTQQPALGGRYRIDFALPDKKIGIELDGYAWHSSREAFTKDRERQRDLELAGWRIIRFSGSEAKNNPARCVQQAAALVRGFQMPNPPTERSTPSAWPGASPRHPAPRAWPSGRSTVRNAPGAWPTPNSARPHGVEAQND